jgi:hypothetical protein
MPRPRPIRIVGAVILLIIATWDVSSRRYVDASQRLNVDLCFLLHNQELYEGRKFSSQALFVSFFPHGTALVGPSCRLEITSFEWHLQDNQKVGRELITSLMDDHQVEIPLRIEGQVPEESNWQHLLYVVTKKMHLGKHARPTIILTSITRIDRISP